MVWPNLNVGRGNVGRIHVSIPQHDYRNKGWTLPVSGPAVYIGNIRVALDSLTSWPCFEAVQRAALALQPPPTPAEIGWLMCFAESFGDGWRVTFETLFFGRPCLVVDELTCAPNPFFDTWTCVSAR